MKPVRIVTSQGEHQVVPLVCRHGLAVTAHAGRWTITHVRSGWAVGMFETVEAATAARVRLLRVRKWSGSKEVILRAPARQIARIARILREHGFAAGTTTPLGHQPARTTMGGVA